MSLKPASRASEDVKLMGYVGGVHRWWEPSRFRLIPTVFRESFLKWGNLPRTCLGESPSEQLWQLQLLYLYFSTFNQVSHYEEKPAKIHSNALVTFLSAIQLSVMWLPDTRNDVQKISASSKYIASSLPLCSSKKRTSLPKFWLTMKPAQFFPKEHLPLEEIREK